MFYALNETDDKVAPQPMIRAFCPCCNTEVIAKCGNIKLHHWAHKNLKNCDEWYEMTAWHLEWQNSFPLHCREVVIQDGDEKHRADIKINNLFIEFQHSSLSAKASELRESFYGKQTNQLIWIIDGTGNRIDNGWKNNDVLLLKQSRLVFLVDKSSNIYAELIGYCDVPLIRKLSLPIELVINPTFPVFVDLGDYVACPIEKDAHEIERTTYPRQWGLRVMSVPEGKQQLCILVSKQDFLNLLHHFPVGISDFQSTKLCDAETLSMRDKRIEIAEYEREQERKKYQIRQPLFPDDFVPW